MDRNETHAPLAAVIGGGPAGLMAAEVLSRGGARVEVFDAMPSVGRKFLLAGKGGMNITHSESRERFLGRYGSRRARMAPLLDAFGADELRAWVHGLGISTFVGSSGRVFPAGMKAAPLLRAWLHRLRESGVRFHMRHRWCGWDPAGDLRFSTREGEVALRAQAAVLALGGGSWSRLGSDGAWVPLLARNGVAVAPLRPSNCGFDASWSDHFRACFAGEPVKPVVVDFMDAEGCRHRRQGEFVITAAGIEGSLVYALSAPLRDTIEMRGAATIHLDLTPARAQPDVVMELQRPRGKESMANHLRKRLGMEGGIATRAGHGRRLCAALAPGGADQVPALDARRAAAAGRSHQQRRRGQVRSP